MSPRRSPFDKDDLSLWEGGLDIVAITNADLYGCPAKPPRSLDGLSLLPAEALRSFERRVFQGERVRQEGEMLDDPRG